MQFYTPSRLLVDKRRIRIDSMADLSFGPCIVIEGIAGQGKSIFLRYLCAIELERSESVPIFVELRRLDSAPSLLDLIASTFSDLDLEFSSEIFGLMAQSGQLALLLDGFDEVPEVSRGKLIDDLATMAKRFPKLRILVSSRPDNDIRSSPQFQVLALAPLTGSDYKDVIGKLIDDETLRQHLLLSIAQHTTDIAELLTTPLSVTLLVVAYKSSQIVPDGLADFYKSLFDVLLRRHDGAKPGFRRPRSCRLSDSEYLSVFKAFCFNAKKKSNIYKLDELTTYARLALQENGGTDKPDCYVQDIIKITCLIVHDGEEYRFIHKSVQEFYAASYIADKPENVSETIYRQLVDGGKAKRDYWSGELNFLEHIDEYRYKRFFLLEYAYTFLGYDAGERVNGLDAQEIRRRLIRELSKSMTIGFRRDDNKGLYFVNRFSHPNMGPFAMLAVEQFAVLFGHREYALTADDVGRLSAAAGESDASSQLVRVGGDAASEPGFGLGTLLADSRAAETLGRMMSELAQKFWRVVADARDYLRKCDQVPKLDLPR